MKIIRLPAVVRALTANGSNGYVRVAAADLTVVYD